MSITKYAISLQSQLEKVSAKPYIIVFIKPKSANWPLVQSLCQKVGGLREMQGFSYAEFDDTLYELTILNTITNLINGWHSAFIFVNGLYDEQWRLIGWLGCYIRSLDAINPQAYCLKAISFSQHDQFIQCISPCRILNIYGISTFHPAPFEDQIQALAVEEGYFRCPHFNAENFRLIRLTNLSRFS